MIDFIDLLKRGFGNINASHHNSTLSIDLGYSNARCQCSECLDLPTQGNTMKNYETNLFHILMKMLNLSSHLNRFFLDNQLVFPRERQIECIIITF